MTNKITETNNKKSIIISIIGLPNAGKSTFINGIVGEKISGVSPRVQTTRNLIRGIKIFDDKYQMIFIDSPGIINSNSVMDGIMMRFAKSSLKESDLFLIFLDIRTINSPNFQIILDDIKKYNKKKILIVNKIDFFDKLEDVLEEKKNEIHKKFIENQKIFDDIFFISIHENNGINELIEYLKKTTEESNFHDDFIYDIDQISDSSERFFASEITREKIFNLLRMELPYSVLVKTEKFEENESIISISQTIFVNKKAHKSILIGSSGSMLKKIGTDSRIELENAFNKKIYLELYVKIKEGWIKNEAFIKSIIGFEGS